MLPRILPLILYPPKANAYIEPFFGGGWVFWNKEKHPIEVINDLDGRIVEVYRVLQDEEGYERLAHKLRWTPYSRAELRRAIEQWDHPDPVERAWATMVYYGMSFWGKSSTSFQVSSKRPEPDRWVRRVERLEIWHQRLRGVAIECRDALELIPGLDGEKAFFYLDPPYEPETRKTLKLYRVEMGREEHERLVRILLGLRGYAVLSGYPSGVYGALEEAGWVRLEKGASLRMAAAYREKRPRRVEALWLSPRLVEELRGVLRGFTEEGEEEGEVVEEDDGA